MKTLSKISATILVFMFTFFPLKTNALVPPLLGFGGLSVYTIPCTCSIAEWGYYGPLVYFPAATFPFAYYLPTVPTTFNKGAFVPGVQACWEYAGFFCFPLPSYGVMAFVGTSL
jgi:hypothetical protein